MGPYRSAIDWPAAHFRRELLAMNPAPRSS